MYCLHLIVQITLYCLLSTAIQFKNVEPMANIMKRSTVRRIGVHDAARIGNGRLENITILSTNNKVTISTRKVASLSRQGQEHTKEVKNALSAGLFRRVLGKACSTKNDASLGSVCSKQSKFTHL